MENSELIIKCKNKKEKKYKVMAKIKHKTSEYFILENNDNICFIRFKNEKNIKLYEPSEKECEYLTETYEKLCKEE
jgi:hypothetical protein